MDCRLPSLMLMMILCSTQFSNAQSPGGCQCHKPVKFVKARQIENCSITRPTVNCNAYEIRIWLKGEKTASCLDPYEPLAKRLLSCAQRLDECNCWGNHSTEPPKNSKWLTTKDGALPRSCQYGYNTDQVEICLCKLKNHTNPKKRRFHGSHIMLRSLDK